MGFIGGGDEWMGRVVGDDTVFHEHHAPLSLDRTVCVQFFRAKTGFNSHYHNVLVDIVHLLLHSRTNPLGMKGHIAQRYGDLIKDIWSGTARSIAPLKLRVTYSHFLKFWTQALSNVLYSCIFNLSSIYLSCIKDHI